MKLNLFTDQKIEFVIRNLDKADFCQQKSVDSFKKKIPDFNPYSLDPQDMGHNQVLTSTVMHAVTMQELLEPFKGLTHKKTNLLDVGCGKGYSTLAYSMLASQLGLNYTMTGLDYHHSFMEKAYLNLDQYKKHLAGG